MVTVSLLSLLREKLGQCKADSDMHPTCFPRTCHVDTRDGWFCCLWLTDWRNVVGFLGTYWGEITGSLDPGAGILHQNTDSVCLDEA